jgi:RNA polymerase sigma-70 factor (ECF subfamily)
VDYQKINFLIDTYKESLYRMCYHLTANDFDAEDLFQETWVRVVRNYRYYDDSKPFEAWLYVIAVNLYRDKYRKKKRWLKRVVDFFTNERKESELSKIESHDFHPEEQFLEKEAIDGLKRNMYGLNDTYRIPIILYFFKEMSYSDISRVLDIPIGTVKSRLNKGKKKLKKRMQDDGYEF